MYNNTALLFVMPFPAGGGQGLGPSPCSLKHVCFTMCATAWSQDSNLFIVLGASNICPDLKPNLISFNFGLLQVLPWKTNIHCYTVTGGIVSHLLPLDIRHTHGRGRAALRLHTCRLSIIRKTEEGTNYVYLETIQQSPKLSIIRVMKVLARDTMSQLPF